MKLESLYCALSFYVTILSSRTEHFELKQIRGGAISVEVATVLNICTFDFCEDLVGAGRPSTLGGVVVAAALTGCLNWFATG